jgi:hypothetical protein
MERQLGKEVGCWPWWEVARIVRWQRGDEKADHRDNESTSVEDIGHESNKVTTVSTATEQPQTLALVRRRHGKVMTDDWWQRRATTHRRLSAALRKYTIEKQNRESKKVATSSSSPR